MSDRQVPPGTPSAIVAVLAALVLIGLACSLLTALGGIR